MLPSHSLFSTCILIILKNQICKLIVFMILKSHENMTAGQNKQLLEVPQTNLKCGLTYHQMPENPQMKARSSCRK